MAFQIVQPLAKRPQPTPRTTTGILFWDGYPQMGDSIRRRADRPGNRPAHFGIFYRFGMAKIL